MTEREAVERIRRTIEESGESRRGWARRWKVSRAHLSDVLSGRRHIGPKLARACGWKQQVSTSYHYEPRAALAARSADALGVEDGK